MSLKLIFLGFVNNHHGIKTNPMNVKVTKEWKSPTTTFEVRIFHGLVTFDMRFIKGFSIICSIITNYLKKITSTGFKNKKKVSNY